MTAQNVATYVSDVFKSTDIKVKICNEFCKRNFLKLNFYFYSKLTVIDSQDEFDKNYPCFAAVNRANKRTQNFILQKH